MHRFLCYHFRVYFVLILSGLLYPSTIRATHIVGGELNYRQLGGNLYEITLVVYRDCFGGLAQFDDPAAIGIFDAQRNLVSTAMVNISTQHSIPNIINTPCLIAPTNICYEVATYLFTTTLAPSLGGYQIVYQRCCRNNSVLNVFNVDRTGATYIASIPDPSLASFNSNPVFNNLPPIFICEDAPFSFNHSAYDVDGDSIVYEICTPLQGADPDTPQPLSPAPPPYDDIFWQSPFSLTNVFGGVPLSINPRTGLLTATPANSGQYVYGVCAKEYRNGVFLGETRRDFQVNVVPCPMIPMITFASIFSPTIVCGSLTAAFTNDSYNALTFIWDFGDLTTNQDTSSLKSPFWTYPDTGEYLATLIAYSGVNSLCNDTAIGIVKVYPIFYADYSIDNQRCSPEFGFKDESYGIGGTANFWDWDLGDGTFSSFQNPVHTYSQAGMYDVRLITSTDSACLDTTTQTISVLQQPESIFNTVLDTCRQMITTLNHSQFTSLSFWNFSGSWNGPEEHPVYQYDQPGFYHIQQVAITDSGCTDTSGILVDIPPLPESSFSYQVDDCDSVVQFSNLSSHAAAYQWEFGDDAESTDFAPEHTYSLAGKIPVRLITTSIYSCKDTLVQDIFFISHKQADFETYLDTCTGQVHFNGVTQNAVTYQWDFGDGQTSSSPSPVHAYSSDGMYQVYLTVNGETICKDSVSLNTVYETPLGELLFAPNAFTPNGDGLNDDFIISIFRPCEIYSLTIFNRWGQVVFETEDAVNAVWDGTYQNKMAEEGIYIYLLKGNNQVRKGVAYLTR